MQKIFMEELQVVDIVKSDENDTKDIINTDGSYYHNNAGQVTVIMKDISGIPFKIDLCKFAEKMNNNFLHPMNPFTAENPFVLRSISLFENNRFIIKKLRLGQLTKNLKVNAIIEAHLMAKQEKRVSTFFNYYHILT